MICPRWLVQSSAVGFMGAALITIPMWMPVETETPPTPRVVTQIEVEATPLEGSTLSERTSAKERHQELIEQRRQALQRERELRERNQRVKEVRTHLYQLYDGPHCPAYLDASHEADRRIMESLREARKANW